MGTKDNATDKKEAETMAILKFRKGNYISLKGSRAQETAVNVPDDLFMKCPACGETLYRPDVVEHAYCCGKCGKYFRLGARNRLRMVLDKGSFQRGMRASGSAILCRMRHTGKTGQPERKQWSG